MSITKNFYLSTSPNTMSNVPEMRTNTGWNGVYYIRKGQVMSIRKKYTDPLYGNSQDNENEMSAWKKRSFCTCI